MLHFLECVSFLHSQPFFWNMFFLFPNMHKYIYNIYIYIYIYIVHCTVYNINLIPKPAQNYFAIGYVWLFSYSKTGPSGGPGCLAYPACGASDSCCGGATSSDGACCREGASACEVKSDKTRRHHPFIPVESLMTMSYVSYEQKLYCNCLLDQTCLSSNC